MLDVDYFISKVGLHIFAHSGPSLKLFLPLWRALHEFGGKLTGVVIDERLFGKPKGDFAQRFSKLPLQQAKINACLFRRRK